MNDVIAFASAHWFGAATVLVTVLPSLIVGLSDHPEARGFLNVVLQLLSVLTHKDSPGTFKLPLVSLSKPPQGFARLGTLALVAFVGVFLAIIGSAHAAPNPDALATAVASDPAAVQPGADAPPVSSQFGGCAGRVCFAPQIALSLVAYNFSSGKLEAAFAPGLGYGFTVNPGKWSSVGFASYFTLDPGAQKASVSFLGSFFNGYLRPGVSKAFVNEHAWRFLFSTGVEIP